MSISQHAQTVVPATVSSSMSRPMTRHLSATRPAVLSIVKLLFILFANLPFLRASPLGASPAFAIAKDEVKSPGDPGLWVYLGTAVALVLLGGAFAGLTIAYVVRPIGRIN
jgi:hypothetical protein